LPLRQPEAIFADGIASLSPSKLGRPQVMTGANAANDRRRPHIRPFGAGLGCAIGRHARGQLAMQTSHNQPSFMTTQADYVKEAEANAPRCYGITLAGMAGY
jgi:hypothetical protein